MRDVIVVGASAGGIQAVTELLAHLPGDLPAFICVVIHRGSYASSNWSRILGRRTPLHVREAREGEALVSGDVLIAPPDRHIRLSAHHIHIDRGPKVHFTRPSVDPLFTSAAKTFGQRVVAVVLSGGGSDGAQGLLDVAAGGGIALAQQPSEADVPSMPMNAIRCDDVAAVLPIRQLAQALLELCNGRSVSIS